MTDDREDEPIWCQIRLGEVAAVLDEYELWKKSAWYDSVDWPRVCHVFHELLQRAAIDGVLPDPVGAIDGVEELTGDDSLALATLMVLEPVTVTRVQLTNGGHRLAAMRRQGVSAVPGMFLRGDIGSSVDASHVYPLIFQSS